MYFFFDSRTSYFALKTCTPVSAENGEIKGSISGVPTANTADKLWLAFQALGDIAFAYPVSISLLEIQVWILVHQNHDLKKYC